MDGGAEPGTVVHRVSARARRITLRISREGRVSCTRPRGVGLAEAERFAAAKAGWVAGHLAALPPRMAVAAGARLRVEGRSLVVSPAAVATARVEGSRLLVPADRAPGPLLAAWLRERAREGLASACARHAAALGRGHGRIRLRDTRSRWGSCTARGDLMFSWRLAMAPAEVLSYVAAHETAHLERMDHSPAFWAVVARLDPAWRERRAWLREHGPALLRHDFA